MKLSKNVLVGSLASAGMILGLVAPATTAFAATGSFNQKDLTAGQTTGDLTDTSYVAIAGTNDAEGTATANSNVNVNVVDGALVLKAVPNFGFGTVAAGETVANLTGGSTSGAAKDGNDSGLLSVIDSRKSAKGFQVSANLGNFIDGSGKAAAGPWSIDLASQQLEDSKGDPISNAKPQDPTSPLSTIATTLDQGTDATVVSLAASTYNLGTINAEFKGLDAATLHLPSTTTATDGVNAYKGTITWTLNSTPATPAA
ncbi:WxL domain-containing protein [Companilactobacillus jidongensis]|uniref:WxL domain-containing protein n=1 Tax=Companilactobacillus jidongensis TaxID=2486006 RepID=UPI0013DDE04E|nr:WxL domain-containing protein [Companilactobacillus jidongensis]